MKLLAIALGMQCILTLLSCSREPERPPETTATVKHPADTSTPEREKPKPAKKEETPEIVEPPEKVSEQEDHLWPNIALAREVLTDPCDETKSCSYWANAREGDWVRFLNWSKNLIIYTVLKHEDKKIEFSVKEYTRDGKEIPSKHNNTRELNVEEDDIIMRSGLHSGGSVLRYVAQWKLYKSNRILNCERRWVPIR